MADYYADGNSKDLIEDLGAEGALADGDTVIIAQGNVNYDAGAAENNLSAKDLLLFVAAPGYVGNLGTKDYPVKVVSNRTSTGMVRLGWGGESAYLESSSASGVIYQLVVDAANGGKVFLGPCDNEYTAVYRGTLQAAADADIERLVADGFGRAVLLPVTSGDMTEVIARGRSEVRTFRTAATLHAVAQARIEVGIDTMAPTNLIVEGGGTVAGKMGDVTNFYARGGEWDLTKATKPITVTNLYGEGPTVIKVAANGPMPNGPVFINTLRSWVLPTIKRV